MRLHVADIEVEVVRKRIKNMYLRVRGPEGAVVVSAPRSVSTATIEAFVTRKLDWIHRQQDALRRREDRQQEQAGGKEGGDVQDGQTLHVWGRSYKICLHEGSRYSLVLRDAAQPEAHFTVRAGSTPEQRATWLREWQRQQLCAVLEEVVPRWEQRTGLHPSEWRTKYMKTRWGTCNTREKRVWFNVRLAEHAPECLEYVVLHELAHLLVPSHNADFKAILDAYMPQWREVRKKLNACD